MALRKVQRTFFLPFSVQEIRRLLCRMIWRTLHSIEHVMSWSMWRRRHQYAPSSVIPDDVAGCMQHIYGCSAKSSGKKSNTAALYRGFLEEPAVRLHLFPFSGAIERAPWMLR